MAIVRKLRSLKNSRSGFTLIELIIAIAILSIISVALVMTIFQLFAVQAADVNRMDAIKQVENALHWINRDVEMAWASSIHPADGSTVNFSSPLNLTWTDNSEPGSPLHSVTYNVDPDGTLERQETVSGATASTRIADYIDASSSNYSFDGTLLTVNLTAFVNGYRSATETRTLHVQPRVSR